MNTCEKCGMQFQPMPGKEWAKECFACWKQAKNAQKPNNEAPKQAYNSGGKDVTNMYVSYTKDLFIAMLASKPNSLDTALEPLWEQAISMIKRAKDAFS